MMFCGRCKENTNVRRPGEKDQGPLTQQLYINFYDNLRRQRLQSQDSSQSPQRQYLMQHSVVKVLDNLSFLYFNCEVRSTK